MTAPREGTPRRPAAPDTTVSLAAHGAARVLTVERPERRNALDRATLRGLARAARAAARDPDARGIVITGRGTVFVAGGDLHELARLRGRAGGRRVADLGHATLDALRAAGLPLVAAVHGDAFGGGCELAAACDYRVVERTARFHWVQGRYAITTAWGGTARLCELVGPAVAMRWLLGARTVDAAEAQAAGFADELVEPGGAVGAACALVETFTALTGATVRAQLALIRAMHGASRDEARMLEQRAVARTWASRDHHDAVARALARLGAARR